MSNKQQTAVEWYIEKLLDLDYEYAKGLITLGVWSERKNSLIQQVKEMEKEQMKGMYVEGSFAKMRYYDGLEYIDADQYYEQTYGGGEK